MRRRFSLFLSFMLLIAALAPFQAVAESTAFSDIAKHWAKDTILLAVEKGYVSGYPNGTFQPNKQVTRAEFIKMLVDALKLPHSQDGKPWYQPYVAAAIETGFHKDKEFNADYNKPLTRMEMARIAVRTVNETLRNNDAGVTDAKWMFDAVNSGMIAGMGNGELAPEGNSTRAQAVAIIERILTVHKGGKLPVDKRAIQYAAVALKGTNIEEMWGSNHYALPMKLDITKGLDITLDQVIIVDYDDPNSAYRQWFPKIEKGDGKEVGNEYLIAFHFKAKNTVAQKGLNHWLLEFTICGPSDYRRAVVPVEYLNQTPIHRVPNVERDKVQEYEGWFLNMAPKSIVNEKIKNHQKVDLYLLRYSDQKEFHITKE